MLRFPKIEFSIGSEILEESLGGFLLVIELNNIFVFIGRKFLCTQVSNDDDQNHPFCKYEILVEEFGYC